MTSSITSKIVPLVIVHGGAGKIAEGLDHAYRSGVKEAAEKGYHALKNAERRGPNRSNNCIALDAVEAAVTAMEDNPLFNAGGLAVYLILYDPIHP